MNEPRHLHLVDRLRGQYHIPVNDGAGPLNGSMTYSREFPTPPIQKEAATEIERLTAALEQIKTVCEDNATVSNKGKAMALSFVQQVATTALV